MPDKETQLLARKIYSMGKLVHERVFRLQQAHLMRGSKNGSFGDLSVAQHNMIQTVRFREELSMSELADLLSVSAPSASTMVDRLVEKGILTREPSPKDRRKVVVKISPEAVDAITDIEEAIYGLFVELVEKIGHETAGKWCGVLEQVKIALDQQ